MVFTLTPEQEQLFKTVLMYISNERKSAVIQVLDSGCASSVSGSLDEITKRFSGLEEGAIIRSHIPEIFDRALSPLELATLEYVPSRQDWRGNTKAFRLTEKGEQVKRYAGFALEMMARLFDQSIYPILGMMNSAYDRVRPQQAVALLYFVNEGPVSIQDLIDDPSLTDRSNIYDILNNFSSFKDGQDNPIPLIEIRDPRLGEGIKGYQWIKGSPAFRTTGSTTERMKRLVGTLSSDTDKVWTIEALALKCGYDNEHVLANAMQRLESKGNVKSGYSNELRTVHITDHGRRLIYSLFEPIRGSIAGDQVSNGLIDRNQLTPNNIVRVLGLYVGIKNQERGYHPAA